MAEIEIGAAVLDELSSIAQISLDFETGFVWKTQTQEDVDGFTAAFQRSRLPKVIKVPFQSYVGEDLETLVRQREVLSVRYEKQVIGYARLEFDRSVNRILVKCGGITPEYRKKGIGSVLVQRIEDIGHQNGIRCLVILLQAKNDSAVHFLKRRGFAFCGYHEFCFPNMEIGLLFSKNLRS